MEVKKKTSILSASLSSNPHQIKMKTGKEKTLDAKAGQTEHGATGVILPLGIPIRAYGAYGAYGGWSP